MKIKRFGIMLGVSLLVGMSSGCGGEKNNLIGDSNIAAVEKSSAPETIDAAESGAEQLGWKQVYLEKVEEMETETEEEPLKYDLIYLDADDVPELVAGPVGHGFHLYTWKDGEICELMDCIWYGTYKAVHRYNPYQGIIARDFPNIDTDIAGIYATNYTEYYKVTEDMSLIEQCRLIEQREEQGNAYFYQRASSVVEITEKEFLNLIEGDWLEITGRYDFETFCSLLEKTDDLWEQEEWLWEGLEQKTLAVVYYTNADGNEFYITDEETLQKVSALLGGLRGVACGRPKMDNYCRISFDTTDGMSGRFIYKGSYLYRDGSGCYKIQDDVKEALADLDYLTSTDYLLSRVDSEEGRRTIQGILEAEGSLLNRLVVNRLEDLNYCLFETSAGQGLEFHILLWGSWEDKEVQQYQMFSLNEEEYFPLDQLSEWCKVTKEDIDFDGKPDLLIYEGYNYGTGGSWDHYRVMRWDEAQGQFVYYPSFPFWMTFWNLENKQVIYKARAGAGDYTVRIYGVVDGEYQEIQGLHIDIWMGILSYYENEELVQEYDVTGMDWDEMEELFREEGLSEIISYARDYG